MEEKFCNWKLHQEGSLNLEATIYKKKFASLESSNDIDTELAAMKAQLLSGSKPAQLLDHSSATRQRLTRE